MMSQHLNTVLEHLKMSHLKKSSKLPASLPSVANLSLDETDNIRTLVNHNGNNSLTTLNVESKIETIPQNGSLVAFDTNKKRHSISVHGNGDIKTKSGRELSPSTRPSPRKLSQDMRFRGINGEDGNQIQIRPVKLKSMCTRAESYDTLHCRGAVQVSDFLSNIFLYRDRQTDYKLMYFIYSPSSNWLCYKNIGENKYFRLRKKVC